MEDYYLIWLKSTISMKKSYTLQHDNVYNIQNPRIFQKKKWGSIKTAYFIQQSLNKTALYVTLMFPIRL
jgi:hypothetical protein